MPHLTLSNDTLYKDLKVPNVKDVKTKISINHTNSLLNPHMEIKIQEGLNENSQVI